MSASSNQQELMARVHARQWFYDFDLPDGSKTKSYLPAGVEAIHTTRLKMLNDALEPSFAGQWQKQTVLDIACHQGYFTAVMAAKGVSDLLAVDMRDEHLNDTKLITAAYGYKQVRTQRVDIEDVRAVELGSFDITLLLGLLYHVENPVRILRLARAVTKKVCVIETQVVPNMTGVVDWGAYHFQRPMVASFGIIDETAETHAPEASYHGICVTPSLEALLWLLKRVGFTRIEQLAVPKGGYEQLASGKRVMVAAWV
jgi:tRNA (mo5U34)-methyltransferase